MIPRLHTWYPRPWKAAWDNCLFFSLQGKHGILEFYEIHGKHSELYLVGVTFCRFRKCRDWEGSYPRHWCSGWSCLLGKSEIAGSSTALVFSFQRNKCFFPGHSYRFSIVESLHDREVACSTSDLQCSNFESVSGWQCHPIHPREVLMAHSFILRHQQVVDNNYAVDIFTHSYSLNLCMTPLYTWSCVSLPRPTASSGWKLPIIV